MKQKTPLRLIYKLHSKKLKKAGWELNLPLEKAMNESPEDIISLGDSQCFRFIDSIRGITDRTETINHLKRIIKSEKRTGNGSSLQRKRIKTLYERLYKCEFVPDYVNIIMDSLADYDRANKGFSINGIKYRRFLGTNGGIKNSTITYVSEDVYPQLKEKLDNGRDLSKKLIPAKLEAYNALICSASTPLPFPDGVIVVKDCITHFKDHVIMIDDSAAGEPKISEIHDKEIEHNASDGYGFMLPSYSRKVNLYLNGKDETFTGMNTRYAWNKGMVITFDYIRFAEQVAGTYYIKDIWGDVRDIRKSEVILTESMLKLWDSYPSWESYKENCDRNGYEFATPKVCPDQLEQTRNTNYQFLQSYKLDDESTYNLCKPTIDEIKEVLGLDYRKSLTYLCGSSLNENNVFSKTTENFIKALMIDKSMINDPYVRRRIYGMISKRITMAKRGSFMIDGNFAMIVGDPYALCQSMFGMEVTGLLKRGEIYHKYWSEKGCDEVVCFRAPMTCHNNIRKAKLNYSDEVKEWFGYIETAICLNSWDTMCDAMNGCDFDGDTFMVTDNEILLQNTIPLPAIMCMQRKADKIVPTEKSIIEANKLAFNDDIGTITNHVTSFFEKQAEFEPGSREYKELDYRIMCGQLFQQNSID